MSELQRITSEYIEDEDRIRLTGEVEGDKIVALWLTQRMLVRLVSHLLKWLEQQIPVAAPEALRNEQTTEMMQGFAQQAASAELSAQQPVPCQTDTLTWLVNSVDLTDKRQLMKLTFKGTNGESVTLSLQAQPLRQWLAIIHQQWRVAEWPQTMWPQWMNEASSSAITPESSSPFH